MIAAFCGNSLVWAKSVLKARVPSQLQAVRVNHRTFQCMVASRADVAAFLVDKSHQTTWKAENSLYDQHKRFLALINPGYLTLHEAADRMYVHHAIISHYLSLGLLKPDAGKAEGRGGWGFLPETIDRFRPPDRRTEPGSNQRISLKDVQYIQSLLKRGMTRPQVALATGRSTTAVAKMIRKFDLRNRVLPVMEKTWKKQQKRSRRRSS
jgi:hypothetical protein